VFFACLSTVSLSTSAIPLRARIILYPPAAAELVPPPPPTLELRIKLERPRPLLLNPNTERVATPVLHVRRVLLEINRRLDEQNIAHFARERDLAEAVRAGVDVEGDW
jgi:hypothetical protein